MKKIYIKLVIVGRDIATIPARDIVGVAAGVITKGAEDGEKYIELSRLNIPSGIADSDTPAPDDGTKKITGTITDIRSAVIGGNTYYYFELDNSDLYYYVAASLSNRAALFNVGDRVTVETSATYTDGLAAAKTVDAASPQTEAPSQAPAEEQTEA